MKSRKTFLGSTMQFNRHGDADHDDRAVFEVTDRLSDGTIEVGILNKQRRENDFYIRFSLPELLEKAMLIRVTTEPEEE